MSTGKDFSDSLVYTVVAEDGSSAVYRVQINDAPGEAACQRTAISNGDLVLLGCGRTMNGLLNEFWTGRMGTLIE